MTINWTEVRKLIARELEGFPKITFKPTSNGYTCNQTGDKVPRGSTKWYAQQIFFFFKPSPARVKASKKAAATLEISGSYAYYACPHCNHTHTRYQYTLSARPYQTTCDRCDEKFELQDR